MNQAKMQNIGAFAGSGPGNGQPNNPDVQNGQIMRYIIHSLQQQPPALGWRAQVGMQERIHWVKQVIDSLRLLPRSVNDIVNIAKIAVNFEQRAFNDANDKETYVRECQKKLGDIRDSRAQQANAQAHQSRNSFQQAPHMQQMGQNLPFPPQLQHQMQASPIPQSQGQQVGINVNPAMNMQAGGGAGGRGMQQPNAYMQNQQPRPTPQTMQLKMTPEDNEAINRLAQQLAATTSPEDRRKIQQNLQNMPPDQLQNIKAKGVHPMAAYFRDRATKEWRRQQQGIGANPNFTPRMQMNPALQAQRQGQPPVNMSSAPGSRGIPGNGQPGGTPFMSNIDHFQGLQADGLRSQEQGQLVVPASNGQGINPEQFRLQQFMNNQQQLAKQNPGGRANPQFIPQQAEGLQQAQQEKPNNAASLQAQPQARARGEPAAGPQQQPSTQNQQGLQGMSQSGTPLSMLTRPVGANVQGPAQPQHQSQGTPQPRPSSRAPNPAQQNTPQTQQNILQRGQPNNNNNNNPQSAPQPQMLAGLPQQLRALLNKHPQQQWKAIIERIKQQPMRQSQFQPGAPPMSQTVSQPGQNAPTSNGPLVGDNTTTSQPMQHSASAGPHVNQGPTPSMAPTQQMMFHQQQQQRRQPDASRPHAPQLSNQQEPPSIIQQGNSLPDLPEHSIAYMDQQQIPLQVYQNAVQRYNLPTHIKTWSDLKQYSAQNPDPRLPMDKFLSVQKLQFHQMVQHMQGRNRPVAYQSRPVSVPPGLEPQPAPQMPPNMQSQPQKGAPRHNQVPMNMMGNVPPVSTEEIQRVRMSNPQLAQMPDPQIRAYLAAYRQNEARKRLGITQQPQNNQHFTFMPGQTSAQPPQPGPPRQQQQQQTSTTPAPAAGQFPQTRPGMPGPRPQPTSAQRPPSQALPPSQVAGANKQSGKGMKRASDGEVTGVPNLNLANNPGGQQHPGPGQSAPPFRMMSKQELSRLSEEEQQIYRERQNQHQQMFLSHIARLTEEVRRASPGLHAIAMDPPSRARIAKVLSAADTKQMLTRFNVFLYQYFLMTKSPDVVKQLLSYKIHLLQQYTPPSIKSNTWEPADQFSIDADYAENAVKDLLARFNHVMSQGPPQQSIAGAPPPADATGSHPLSADNLKKHQDMQAAQRAKRPVKDVPSAPTASQPPFSFTDASTRGQGTPRYAPGGLKQDLKQEDLKLPSKRQKKTHQDNAASTPVEGQATPAVSPQTAKARKPDNLPFKCTVLGCDFHDKGFATKSDLDNHSNAAHKPVEEHIADPLAFFLESMRNGLGLDDNGEPKAKPKAEVLKAPAIEKTLSNSGGLGSKPPTPVPATAAMTRGVSQASGSKDALPTSSQPAGGRAEPATADVTGTVRDQAFWDASNVSLPDLQNAFGDLANGGPLTSLAHHDPLGANNDITDFMDQFMESEAWTKMQETAINIDTASSKATESPAQFSDRGPGNSDISKGDDLFIKIGPQDTELAESWALPELRIEPEGGAPGADEVDEWMKMDFADASTGDVDAVGDIDFEWKEVGWEKLLAEQDKATAVFGNK